MAWGDESSEGTKQCENCGAAYTLFCTKLPVREKGYIECKCGHTIEDWNSSHTYRVEFADGGYGKKVSD